MKDTYEQSVNKAVFAVQEGPSTKVLFALSELSGLDSNTLLSELFLQVHAASQGINLSEDLEPNELIRDVDFVRQVVRAVEHQDIVLLKKVIHGDYSELVMSLVFVIALLKDTQDRIL